MLKDYIWVYLLKRKELLLLCLHHACWDVVAAEETDRAQRHCVIRDSSREASGREGLREASRWVSRESAVHRAGEGNRSSRRSWRGRATRGRRRGR